MRTLPPSLHYRLVLVVVAMRQMPMVLETAVIRIPLRFDVQCTALGLPQPAGEYRFHPTRKWRADWCFVAAKLMVEVEGGAWTNGRHTRGAGFVADLEKYAEATILGFRILRVTPQQVANGEAVELARRALVVACGAPRENP